MQKISPHLWFDDEAEDAVRFYVDLFPNSRILSQSRYPEGAPHGTPGSVMSITFELDAVEFMALNGGPMFRFNEAVSFFVKCETQEEVDRYWNALIAGGGEESMCGWLKDRWGLSWQIVPIALGDYLGDPDPEKAQRAMQAMLAMRKIDIAAIARAHAGT